MSHWNERSWYRCKNIFCTFLCKTWLRLVCSSEVGEIMPVVKKSALIELVTKLDRPCTTVRNSDDRKYWPSNEMEIIICNLLLVALDLFSAKITNFPLDNFLVKFKDCCSESWIFFGQICKLLFHFCKNCEWLI